MHRKERTARVLSWFAAHHPDATTELVYRSPYELLVAVILSAQCTDKRVNSVTPAFFQQYPTAESLATATPDDIFPLIRSISYPNNKAKHLAGMARMLTERFGGTVPGETDQLQELPGVGRKTANVIASVVYRRPAMAVDTHVFRVSARLGLTVGAKNPLQCERQLVRSIPQEQLAVAHHWLILHGRYTCLARSPRCGQCGLKELCVYYGKRKQHPPGRRTKRS
jgi:endonuclease-3